MTITIASTGFVITTDVAIYAYGATLDAAWADFRREMKMARIDVLTDDEEAPDNGEAVTRIGDFHVSPASAALLARVESAGGAIDWTTGNGVACLREELDELEAE